MSDRKSGLPLISILTAFALLFQHVAVALPAHASNSVNQATTLCAKLKDSCEIIMNKENISTDNKGHKYAFIVGINWPKSNSPDATRWGAINKAHDDAKNLGEALRTNYQYNTVTMLGADATRENILSIFNEIAEKLNKNDTLVVFIASHGDEITTKVKGLKYGFIAPYGSIQGDPKTLIALEELDFYSTMIAAKRQLWILASCYSGLLGAMERKRGVNLGGGQYPKTDFAKYLLTAGSLSEPAKEDDKGGVFTTNLVKALNGAENRIGVEELYSIVKDSVAAAGNSQVPNLSTLSGHKISQRFWFEKNKPTHILSVTTKYKVGPNTYEKGSDQDQVKIGSSQNIFQPRTAKFPLSSGPKIITAKGDPDGTYRDFGGSLEFMMPEEAYSAEVILKPPPSTKKRLAELFVATVFLAGIGVALSRQGGGGGARLDIAW